MRNRGLCAVLVVSTLAGCAAPVEFESEDVSTNTEFLFDSTGTIEISVTKCAWTSNVTGPKSTTCPVKAGFVLVGGGAEIESNPVPNGAMLTGSYPNWGASPQTWVARAKDHNLPQKYRLRAAAIGLRLVGISQAALRNRISYTQPQLGTSGALSTKEIPVPSGHIVLGGGAFASNLHLLVASRPKLGSSSTPQGWVAVSKDHHAPDKNSVSAFLISMPPCITGWGCVQTKWTHASTEGDEGGHKSVTLEVAEPITAVGAEAIYSGDGRLLTDMWPKENLDSVEVMASSKDHQTPSVGNTFAYALSILRN
jgi:hypothetical protein